MWIPETWEDLERAIDVQIERSDLDFKTMLPPGQKASDIAKDVAAMAIDGGVIVLGMDESEGVAAKITPVPLKGAVERLQQIIDANTKPPLLVDIRPLREHDGDDEGVLVLSVPASWSAPHQYRDRFPARSGSTTRWLDEREIEALYRRRQELYSAPAQSGGVVGHVYPPGVNLELDRGVGLLRMHLRPVGGQRHPAEPYLRQPLASAVKRATENVGEFIAVPFTAGALEWLRTWTPAGANGWRAGAFVGDISKLGSGPAVGAMYSYGNGFSFSITLALTDDQDGPQEAASAPPQMCAWEHLWAIETLSALRIGGKFYESLPDAALLCVDLELGGLLGATSWQATHGMSLMSSAPKVTENLYFAGGIFSSHELAGDPGEAVHELLDPFFVAILDDDLDLVNWIATPQ